MKATDLALLVLALWCGLGVFDQSRPLVRPQAQSPPASGLFTGP